MEMERGQVLVVSFQFLVVSEDRDRRSLLRKSVRKKVNIFGDIGIIAERSKYHPVLDSDEVQAAPRALFPYPVSTRYHRRQMGLRAVVVALVFRATQSDR